MKKLLIVLLSLLMVFSVTACSSNKDNSNAQKFTGSSVGMQGQVTVEMTVEDGKILSVEVIESSETHSLTHVAVDRIPAQMVEHQTTKVDAVTGATLTSNAIMRAASNAAESAGLDMDALNANAYTATAGEDEVWSTDIVVVGGGGAGLSAAIAAAQEGANVILIEKASVLGGNTMMAGGAYNAVDTVAQLETVLSEAQKSTLDSYLALKESDENLHLDLFPEWKEVFNSLQSDINAHFTTYSDKTAGVDMPGFDSVSLHMWQIYIGGLRQMNDGTWIASDIELARTLAENALEAYEWAESIGVGAASGEGAGETLYTVLGAMWPRTHSYTAGESLIQVLREAAESVGVTIYTETAGTELITDGNKVVGLIAEKADGTKITINTEVGVILASGGYCANPEMVKEYDQYWGDDLSSHTLTTNVGTNKGDGINMAMAIGADTVDLGVAQMMPSSSALKGTMTDGIWGDASQQIWIDGNGERFVNEYAERDVLAKSSLALDGGVFYIIYAGPIGEDGLAKGANPESSLFGTSVQQMVDNGHVWYGSTLAELAEASQTSVGGAKSSFTEEQLREVIETYNSYVANQHDPDFGKEVLAGAIDLEAIENDPTVGIVISPRKSSLHHTMGGLVINTDAQVLDADGNVIEGLWAAGEVTGGVHAGNRLGGNAIADIFVFGKIAGQNAGSSK